MGEPQRSDAPESDRRQAPRFAAELLGKASVRLLGGSEVTLINFSSWSEIVWSFEPTPKILISSVILAGIMGIIGGFLPAIRAARVSPVEAMRA